MACRRAAGAPKVLSSCWLRRCRSSRGLALQGMQSVLNNAEGPGRAGRGRGHGRRQRRGLASRGQRCGWRARAGTAWGRAGPPEGPLLVHRNAQGHREHGGWGSGQVRPPTGRRRSGGEGKGTGRRSVGPPGGARARARGVSTGAGARHGSRGCLCLLHGLLGGGLLGRGLLGGGLLGGGLGGLRAVRGQRGEGPGSRVR